MYKNYQDFYFMFSEEKGYYEACDILAFQSTWVNKKSFLKEIKREITQTQQRTGRKHLVMGDFCSGYYAWLVRHFYTFSKTIYCLDINQSALDNIRAEFVTKNRNINLICGDIRNSLLNEKSLDFAYCGFNFYLDFVDPITKCLKPMGGYLFMKPKDGDDLEIRRLVKSYDLKKRMKEICQITNKLRKKGEVQYKEFKFEWQFKNFDLDRILAALSVVSLGQPARILTIEEYEIAKKYLVEKVKDRVLILSQICSIWCGHLS